MFYASDPISNLSIMRQYIVNAFTNQPFAGNPAAVCIMERWPSERLMMDIAAQNNLSETAFLVLEQDEPDADGNPSADYHFHLRWFTPTEEVGLCGHATLASAYVILNHYMTHADSVEFVTQVGKVSVCRMGNYYELSFPKIDAYRIDVDEAMAEALGVAPKEAWLGLDLVCILECADEVQNCHPNQDLLKALPGRMVHVTAPGTTYTCHTRSFGPKIGIAEDPVCGSAYCQVAPYWSERSGRPIVIASQDSARGGKLMCTVEENRVRIAGEAQLFAIVELMINP